MNPVAVAHGTNATPDGVLLQEAAAGGGASYAALYDRYSEQIYNYCLRLTGSPDDAADATQDAFVNVLGRLQRDDNPVLDFSAYLFAAARNESYALMRRRNRTQLSDEPPERAVYESDVETDPERAALLRDSQESVRLANAQLAPRHREVLALREVGGRSYEEIGQIMGISENAAAQLIWRARSKLKGALTAGAVASVVATSEDCETAQVLINRLQDGESVTDAEHEWLEDHLDECQRCRAARGMIFEVATSYRLWAPVAVLATMKADVLAAAGSVVGANWTGAHVAAGAGGGGGGGAGAGGSGATGSGATGTGATGTGAGGSGAGGSGAGGSGAAHAGGAGNASGAAHATRSGAHATGAAHASGAAHAGRFAKRPRGAQAAAGAAITAGVFAAIALVVAGLGNNESGVKPAQAPASDSAPAQKSSSSAPKSAQKAAATAVAVTPTSAQAIHPTPQVIPMQASPGPGVDTPGASPKQGGTPGNGPRGGPPPGQPAWRRTTRRVSGPTGQSSRRPARDPQPATGHRSTG